jgi:hypothetical protein
MSPYNGLYYKKKCKSAPLQRIYNGLFYYPLGIYYGELLELKHFDIRVSGFVFYPLAGKKRNLPLLNSKPIKEAQHAK